MGKLLSNRNPLKPRYKELMAKTKLSSKVIDICENCDHIPNAETKKSLKNIDQEKNLIKYESLEDFFNKMGI